MSYRYEVHKDRHGRAAKTYDGVLLRACGDRFATRAEAYKAGDRISDKWIDAWTEVFESNEPVNA